MNVLKDVTLGNSVKEIVERSRRSEPTIRSHIRALLAKTGTRTQIELVRVTLGLFDTVERMGDRSDARTSRHLAEPNQYSTCN